MDKNEILILWTSADRDVALKMVFMYTYNSKKNNWWHKVRLLVWGPSAKLLSEDTELQDYLKQMIEKGIDISACQSCTDMYGVTEKIKDMGIDVYKVGESFTKDLKSGIKVITI